MAEKIKKVKKVRAKDAGEIIHHYANQVNDKDTKGSYSYDGKKFYKDGTCFSKIIDIDKKVVLVHPFYNSGGWGGGYTSYNLERAFSEDWTILRYSRILHLLPDNLSDFTDYQLFDVIIENIYDVLVPILDIYNREKYLIKDTKSFRQIYNQPNIIDSCNEKIKVLSKKFNISKKDILNYIFNRNICTTVSWSGWSDSYSVTYKIDKSIKFYLTPAKWHTAEEQDILDFKNWKSKYFNLKSIASGAYYRQGRTYEEIWKDKEFKAEYEKNIEAGNNLYKHNKEARRQYELEQTLAKEKEKVDKWLKGDIIGNLWNIPIHLRIKDGRIETTRNAVIPLEAGKLLFKLFNKVRQGSTDKVYDSNKFKVGFYEFNKIHYVGGHWFVVVGCHHLRDTEIDLFINQYNLEEWKQMK